MLCLLAAGAVVPLMSASLTLAWTHSVERIPWEEDWVERDGRLALVRTRVRGSGAGMEPAPDARLVDGAWTWAPRVLPLEAVTLRRSGATDDWRICLAGSCREMGDYVGAAADPVVLRVCPAPGAAPGDPPAAP